MCKIHISLVNIRYLVLFFFLLNFAPNLRIFTIISKVNILNNCNSQILETMLKESEWS